MRSSISLWSLPRSLNEWEDIAVGTDLDYSHYYRIYHQDDPEHTAMMVRYHDRQLAPYLPANRSLRVLDIGCGMGFAMRSLMQAGFKEVEGIDVDRSQAEFCISKGLKVALVADTTQFLEAHPARFDLVTMLDVLEHIPVDNQVPLLKSLLKALTPGSKVIIQVPNANSPVSSRWRYNDFTHHASFTENSIRFVLANAGFVNIHVPGAGRLGRPPAKLWTSAARYGLRRWLVNWWWRQVLQAEVPGLDPSSIPLGLNLMAIAETPQQVPV